MQSLNSIIQLNWINVGIIALKNVRQYNVLNILSKLLIWQIRVYAWYEKYYDEVSPHTFNSKKSMTLMLIIDDNFIKVNYICAWLPPLCHQEQNTFFLWCVFAFFCKQLRSVTDLKCNSGIIIPFMQMFSLISASLISSFTHWWLCVNKHDYIVAFFYVPEVKRQRLNFLNKIFLV